MKAIQRDNAASLAFRLAGLREKLKKSADGLRRFFASLFLSEWVPCVAWISQTAS